MVTLPDIEAAHQRIRPTIHVTPCEFSETFTALSGNPVYFKLENLHMTGSFKERGALNKLLLMSPEERAKGVICASAGNHAQGVAYHATRLGVRAIIYMPEHAPITKVNATARFGGEVVLYGKSFDEALAEAKRRGIADGLTFIHAFDDPAVIAGQGTIGLEILGQNPFVEAILVPVGGGGLIGGVACAIKETNPKIKIVGVQTSRIPSMLAAVAHHATVELPAATSIADGIAVRRAGEQTLPLVEKYVDDLVTVEEEEIASAILYLLEREKTVAEGAGATAVAALLHNKTNLKGKKTVALVCGGNIDPLFLSHIIERGMVKDGRLVKLRVMVPDRPGALHSLTGVLADMRVNVVTIQHDRAYHGVALGHTAVEATIETRGSDHLDALFTALGNLNYPFERIR
ncbi:threonine ammonia-lyase [Bryobacter aggregatus]|uniref:threonine ammonia-lyase n=1 Tax=Bryobacter aggregatus TaxID=360054 RepID=UPI00055B4545|nr:threonine ammonia-lyase [Bryobacter aggregatus]